jgi:hypothetical protein
MCDYLFTGGLQMPFGMAVIILYLMVILFRSPYIRKGDDRLHLIVQVELFLFLQSAYTLYAHKDDLKDPATDALLSALLIGLCILALLIALLMAALTIRKLFLKKERKTPEQEIQELRKLMQDPNTPTSSSTLPIASSPPSSSSSSSNHGVPKKRTSMITDGNGNGDNHASSRGSLNPLFGGGLLNSSNSDISNNSNNRDDKPNYTAPAPAVEDAAAASRRARFTALRGMLLYRSYLSAF